jgi:hypothetical protein
MENTRSLAFSDAFPIEVITDPAVIPIAAVLIGIPTTNPRVLLKPNDTIWFDPVDDASSVKIGDTPTFNCALPDFTTLTGLHPLSTNCDWKTDVPLLLKRYIVELFTADAPVVPAVYRPPWKFTAACVIIPPVPMLIN